MHELLRGEPSTGQILRQLRHPRGPSLAGRPPKHGVQHDATDRPIRRPVVAHCPSGGQGGASREEAAPHEGLCGPNGWFVFPVIEGVRQNTARVRRQVEGSIGRLGE